MSTRNKSASRLQILQDLTNSILDHVSCLEEELAELLSNKQTKERSEKDYINDELQSIRRSVAILHLKEKYAMRTHHKLRQRIRHLNHHLSEGTPHLIESEMASTLNLRDLNSTPSMRSMSSLSMSNSYLRRPLTGSGMNLDNFMLDSGNSYRQLLHGSSGGAGGGPGDDGDISILTTNNNNSMNNMNIIDSINMNATPQVIGTTNSDDFTDTEMISSVDTSINQIRFTICDKNGKSEATIDAFGATLVSWKVDLDSLNNKNKNYQSNNNNSELIEQMFLSKHSYFDNTQPIRGGIPIVFPQFALNGKMPLHGFARVLPWRVKESTLNFDANGRNDFITFECSNLENNNSINNNDLLKSDPWYWIHKFKLEYSVRLTDYTMYNTLIVSNLNDSDEMENENISEQNVSNNTNNDSTTTNNNDEDSINNITFNKFRFNVAFHNYFKVSDINNVLINGLQNVPYYDKVSKKINKDNESINVENIRINRETDRIYMDNGDKKGKFKTVNLIDSEKNYKIVIKRENLTDIIVWNPWINKSKEIKDFGNEEYKEMVCIESGRATKESMIELKAGHSAVFTQEITIVPM